LALVVLPVAGQRLDAVCAVLDGADVVEVAERVGVHWATLHRSCARIVTLVPCEAAQSLRLLSYDSWAQDRGCGRDGSGRLRILGASSAHELGRNR